MPDAADILRDADAISDSIYERVRSSGEIGVWQVLRAIEYGADQLVVAEALSEATGAPRLEVVKSWPDAADLVGEEVVKLRYCAPLRELPDGTISLAMVDPSDVESIADVRIASGRLVSPMTVTPDQLERLWNGLYPEPGDYREMIAQLYTTLDVEEGDEAQRLLNVLLLQTDASDEPLVVDWSEDEIDITGLCRASTRRSDEHLAGWLTERLRVLTDSPPPAGLGGLTIHTGRSQPPALFLVHFGEEATAVEPVDRDTFDSYFSESETER